jgi:hypothetical protein
MSEFNPLEIQQSLKEDKSLNPMDICFFGSIAIVAAPDRLADLIEEFGFRRRCRRSAGSDAEFAIFEACVKSVYPARYCGFHDVFSCVTKGFQHSSRSNRSSRLSDKT